MKSSFLCKRLKNPFADPVVLVRFIREKNAIVFDLGDITALSTREILSISHAFVTHMHIDHFIGFDYLMRYNLRREKALSIYGPPGIINAVEGKLRGYTWNLIKDYPLKIEVFEVTGQVRLQASFYASEGFSRIDREPETVGAVLLSEDDFMMEVQEFWHQIPVLGYSLVEHTHFNINKALLVEMGLTVGPWLKELKAAIRLGINDKVFTFEHQSHHIDELKELVLVTKGDKITYITDIASEDRNIENAVRFAKGADILYIEAYFMEKDRDRALQRNHITARQAGMIAREAGVKRLEIIHISPKYSEMPQKVIEEAMNEFLR
jgi:ribonuclease Z